MGKRMRWLDREFDFDFPADRYRELVDRLKSAPGRLRSLVESLPGDVLVRREAEAWSIQENVGHLSDVETLFTGRLDDYESGASTLRPADVTGRKTTEANHNAAELDTLLDRFQTLREAYVARLEAMNPELFARSALHPRLNRPMRLCDAMLFQAEHDDHHLGRIEELIRSFTTGG